MLVVYFGGLRSRVESVFPALAVAQPHGCFAGPKSLCRDLATMGNSHSFLILMLQFMHSGKKANGLD